MTRMRGALYERVYEIETLTQAWRVVRRGGGAGVDGQTVAAFEAHWSENMAELATELRERRYHPLPLRQYLLARPDGGQRPISLLALRDRLVQRAVLEVVRPSFQAVASPAGFGVLPGRGVGEALARAEQARRSGLTWVVRADVRAFFEEVDHGRVVAEFRATVGDDELTGLVEEWLAVGVLQRPRQTEPAEPEPERRPRLGPGALLEPLRTGLEVAWTLNQEWSRLELLQPAAAGLAGWVGAGLGRWRPGAGRALPLAVGAGVITAGALALARLRRAGWTGAAEPGPRGTPQGSPLSPLLATSVLLPLDRALDRPGQALARYVDDLLLVCRDEAGARQGLEDARQQVERLGLALNEAKTVVQPYDAGFEFLGATLPQLPADEPLGLTTARALAAAFRRTGYWRARRLAARVARPGAWGERGGDW